MPRLVASNLTFDEFSRLKSAAIANDSFKLAVLIQPREAASIQALLVTYVFATLATILKTIAWWFNQWPFILNFNFFLKWFMSALIAGVEYLPITYAFVFASRNNIALSLMTAYMVVTDNIFRMLQQVGLGMPLAWFDWVGAAILAAAVVYQGTMHYFREHRSGAGSESNRFAIKTEHIPYIIGVLSMVAVIFSLSLSLAGGPTGQVYTLGTLATGLLVVKHARILFL